MAISAFQATAAAIWRARPRGHEHLGRRSDLLAGRRDLLGRGRRAPSGRGALSSPQARARRSVGAGAPPPAAPLGELRRSTSGTGGGRGRRPSTQARTSASVACTRRRSCSTQREQFRRCTSRRRTSRSASAPSSRSEIRPSARSHHPLPPSTEIVWRSSLRASASSAPSSALGHAQRSRHLGARPLGQHHQRQRAGRDGSTSVGQPRADFAQRRRRVDRTGGAGGHGSQWRVLHSAADNTPINGAELRYVRRR